MNVPCTVEQVEIENDEGRLIESVEVTCGRCGRKEQSFGTSDRSVRRCAILLRENCDRDEENFYACP